MKSKIIRILSYLLVALLASTVTLAIVVKSIPNRYSKLEELEKLILERLDRKSVV